MGRLAGVADTRLYVAERGERPAFPLLVLHGGPGLDHTEFSGYLDPLTEGGSYRLVLADARAGGRSDRTALRGTWTRGRMAQGVSDLAASLGVRGGYATLGHSSGAFVVVQHAGGHPGGPRGTVVSPGLAAARGLGGVGRQLAALEPAGLRPQVRLSWARERQVGTADEAAAVLAGPWPFHFRDPGRRRAAGVPAPHRRARPVRAGRDPPLCRAGVRGIDLEHRLGEVRHPVLVLAGRHDRVCPAGAAQDMADRLPNAALVVFENSAHMTFADEPDSYRAAVRQFPGQITG